MGCTSSKSPETAAPAPAAKPAAAPSAAASAKFSFASGLPDCCTSNPESYKVVAELPGSRLVEMTLPPGGEDTPHDHPVHYMYIVKGGKLSITGYNEKAEKAGDPHEVEMPDGAPPILPAGPHQVKNVGDNEVKIVFVEPLLTCQPCGELQGTNKTPFMVKPACYKILAEDGDWFTGMMEMEAGDSDPPHSHRDHFVYVLEGDGITIFPGTSGDLEQAEKLEVPIKPGMALPVPAGPHFLKNTGTVKAKLIFFEMKK